MDVPCTCGTPERRAAETTFPVEYSVEMGVYFIVYGAAHNSRAIMRYCFWCGGELPQRKYIVSFTEPDETESDALKQLMAQVKTVQDVRSVLGTPDEVIDISDCPMPDIEISWKVQYTYRAKWDTLDLYVHEAEDGVIIYGYSGKRKQCEPL